MIDEEAASNSCYERMQTTTTFGSKEILDNNEGEEKEEQIEPPENPNLSSDKEVSTEASSFIIVPLETHHEPKASATQCLEEPSNVKILKDLCTQAPKSRNYVPKTILQSKQVGYLRCRNILPKCYEISWKKGREGLVTHPNNWGKHCKFSFPFYFPHFNS